MELKVWVEGIQRVVCGVSEQTTCQDVVIALAHASGKTGRFTLIEKWRENERLLTPVEQPLKVLHKWGEYATDVQFILRHSGVCAKTERAGRRTEKPLLPHSRFESRQGSGSVKRNLTFSGPRGGFNAPKHHGKKPPGVGQNSSLESLDGRSSFSSRSTMSPYASFDKRQQRSQPYPQLGHPGGVNTAIVHSPQSSYGSTCSPKSDSTPFSSLERQKKGRPSPVPVVPPHNNNNNCKPSVQALTKTLPPPVKGPRIHIEEYNLDLNLSPANNKHTKERQLSPKNFKQDSGIGGSPPNEHVITEGKSNGVSSLKVGEDSRQVEFRDKATNADDASKEELIKLVNLQMEKLESQESLMAKLNSEVTMLEKKETAYQTKYKSIQEEMKRLEATEYDYDNELEELELVSWEDKLELERHRRDNLRSEITLIRSRVDSKELEMVTVKRKEEKLVEDIEEVEKKQKLCAQETEETEMKVLQEISELQKQINQKLVDHEENQGSVDELLSDVKKLESEILERKTSIAGLEKDLLHANLEQFRVMPTDCLRTRESRPFDRNSPSRPGSARKMTQSPQRLIEAVPTIKDPHGLWV